MSCVFPSIKSAIFPSLKSSLALFESSFFVFSVGDYAFTTRLGSEIVGGIVLLVLYSSLIVNDYSACANDKTCTKNSVNSVLNSTVNKLSNNPENSSVKAVVNVTNKTIMNTIVKDRTSLTRTSHRTTCRRSEMRQHSKDSCDGAPMASGPRVFSSGGKNSSHLCSFGNGSCANSCDTRRPAASVPATAMRRLNTQFSCSPALRVIGTQFISSGRSGYLGHGRAYGIVFRVIGQNCGPICSIIPAIIRAANGGRVFVSPDVRIRGVSPKSNIQCATVMGTSEGLGSKVTQFYIDIVRRNGSVSGIGRFGVPAGEWWSPDDYGVGSGGRRAT